MNRPASIPALIERIDDLLAEHLDNMVRIQMEGLPQHWSEADRREMAERFLFGEKR